MDAICLWKVHGPNQNNVSSCPVIQIYALKKIRHYEHFTVRYTKTQPEHEQTIWNTALKCGTLKDN